jgi:ribosome maturation factor RimP
MATDVATRVSELVEPLLEAHGAELYDVVLGGATLQVLVGGDVDLEGLATLTREISAVLDEADPMPDRYTLEVSSPGLERNLRTPRHFAGAIGETIKVKTTNTEARRADGVLITADDEGFVVDTGTEQRRISYSEVERARTVFVWGATEKPVSPSRNRPERPSEREKGTVKK